MTINYTQKDTHIAVKWKKTEIGRIQSDGPSAHYYSPRGCGGAVKSDTMKTVQAVKQHIEQSALAIHFYYG